MYYASHFDTSEEIDLKNNDSCNLRPVISATLLNSTDSEGWTAAHIAASRGFKVVFKDLLH